jgi:hypothetical protein
MKPDQYNPKAREAFAKSLIDIGVAIFKSIMLLFTVVPLAAIFKSAFDGKAASISLLKIMGSLTSTTQWIILALLFVAFLLGHYLRKEGLRHLHDIEKESM